MTWNTLSCGVRNCADRSKFSLVPASHCGPLTEQARIPRAFRYGARLECGSRQTPESLAPISWRLDSRHSLEASAQNHSRLSADDCCFSGGERARLRLRTCYCGSLRAEGTRGRCARSLRRSSACRYSVARQTQLVCFLMAPKADGYHRQLLGHFRSVAGKFVDNAISERGVPSLAPIRNALTSCAMVQNH